MYASFNTGDVKTAFVGGTTFTNAFNLQTSVTSTATHTKGVWSEIEASTDHEVHGVHLMLFDVGESGAARRALLDIGIGAASSETVIIPNIIFSSPADFSTLAGDMVYFPIHIPAGQRVSARMQKNQGGTNITDLVAVFNYKDGLIPSFTGCEAIGANTGTTAGLTVNAGAGAYGLYTTMATLDKNYKALLPLIAITNATTTANSFISVEVVVNRGTDRVLFRRGFRSLDTDSVLPQGDPMPFYTNLFSGDIIKVRAWASSVVGFSTILYGFY